LLKLKLVNYIYIADNQNVIRYMNLGVALSLGLDMQRT